LTRVAAVIPARFGATRFPGKPLAPILGKPMLQWVIEGVSQSQKISDIIVATDDEKIADLCKKIKTKFVMTGNLPTGSDRVWAAIKNENYDFVINVQGDEPLMSGAVIDAMVDAINLNPSYSVYTLCRDLDVESLASVQTAKIVLNHKGEAIYFSRFPIPHSRHEGTTGAKKHIGIYGYKKSFLGKFCEHGPCEIEQFEGLEQLRVLYMGEKIKVIPVNYESWGVDIPEDINKIESIMRGKNG
jgi:3-deoxy-manno-octulosonate cytidylyltransferase (CMP-KDO synthetase)